MIKRKSNEDMNVLVYWNNDKSIHPASAKAARHVLCISTTNTSIERFFSESESTITSRRMSLQTSK